MTFKTIMKSGAAALVLAGIATPIAAAPAKAQSATTAKSTQKLIVLSIGRGEQVNLPSGISDVVVANPGVADVDVRGPKQIYIFAKGPGETTLYATDAAGRTVYSATVRVGSNFDSLDQMIAMAMPEADIKATTMNGRRTWPKRNRWFRLSPGPTPKSSAV
jgi:pilus assembly protein CpaC